MTTEALPAGITVYPEEHGRLTHPDLDYDYIDQVAAYVAVCLRDHQPVEACFQPGDGTRYNLLFTPLGALRTAPPRHPHGRSRWGQHAVSGCRNNDAPGDTEIAARYYARDAILVTWVEYAAYPIRLTNEFTADYIAQKFNTTIVSGCTLAILFRAIAHHSTKARTL